MSIKIKLERMRYALNELSNEDLQLIEDSSVFHESAIEQITRHLEWIVSRKAEAEADKPAEIDPRKEIEAYETAIAFMQDHKRKNTNVSMTVWRKYMRIMDYLESRLNEEMAGYFV